MAKSVAPSAGAWIETWLSLCRRVRTTVAPSAGAWIETNVSSVASIFNAVAPSAGAWIETNPVSGGKVVKSVAPSAGAWIETICAHYMNRRIESHPLRVRGLKPTGSFVSVSLIVSHPLRVRGLKRFQPRRLRQSILGRTLCGCVD